MCYQKKDFYAALYPVEYEVIFDWLFAQKPSEYILTFDLFVVW
jgi:hypothetical protein